MLNFTQTGPKNVEITMEAHLDPSEYCDSHHIDLDAANSNKSAAVYNLLYIDMASFL